MSDKEILGAYKEGYKDGKKLTEMNSILFEISDKNGKKAIITVTSPDPCLTRKVRDAVLLDGDLMQHSLCRIFSDKDWLPEDCD